MDDLDLLCGLLEQDLDEEICESTQSSEKTNSVPSFDEPCSTLPAEEVNVTTLGLDLSDDDADLEPSDVQNDYQPTKEPDPLEAELFEMEKRVSILKRKLAAKKQINCGAEKLSFTKLTNITEPSVTRTVIGSDQKERISTLTSRKSEVHTGDTDSEDDENNKNPLESSLTSFGKFVKKRIAHEDKDRVDLQEKRRRVQKDLSCNSPRNRTGWQGIQGSLVSIKCEPNSSTSESDARVDPFSGIKIVKPLVMLNTMKELMEGRRMIQMSSIPLHIRGGDIEDDWVTIGVIVVKSSPKTSQKGSQYSIWQLSDLKDCTKTVSLFLFAGAHQNLWKESIGTVVGILNAQVMKDRQGEKSSDIIALSVNQHQKVLIIGTSKDLGWCRGRTKQGTSCRQFVNKNVCEFCIYHIQREYSKMSAKRSDLQSSFSRVDPRRALQNKILGKNQVICGGKLYCSQNIARPNPADKAKDLATLTSLKLKLKANAISEEEKQKSFTLKRLTDSEVTAVKDISKDSEAFAEKLLAPTFGARNLLKHMTQEETKEKMKVMTADVKSITAKELLLITQRKIERHKKSMENHSHASPTMPVTSSSNHHSTSIINFPLIGRGVNPGQEVELDVSVSPSDHKALLAKLKAVSVVSKQGGLAAEHKNDVKNRVKASSQQFKNNVQKRLWESDNSDVENSSKKCCSSHTDSEVKGHSATKSLLGEISLSEEQMENIMNARSSHANLIEVAENEEMEKYYNNLEKKEMLENKLASVMEVPTSAVVCIQCRYMALSASEMCKAENHELKVVKAKKRFFECQKCKIRTMSLDRLPRKACGNCNESTWRRVPMGKGKNGPKLESEILSLRGDEIQYYSGAGSEIYLHV